MPSPWGIHLTLAFGVNRTQFQNCWSTSSRNIVVTGPTSVAPYWEDSLTPEFTREFPTLGASGPPPKAYHPKECEYKTFLTLLMLLTTYWSVFKVSTASGKDSHFSRKNGTTIKAFDFVLSKESRIFIVFGIMGAAEGSCKDVGR